MAALSFRGNAIDVLQAAAEDYFPKLFEWIGLTYILTN